MVPIQRVLCPVDLSAISERALRHAAALAAWYEARLTVLFVRTGDRVESTEHDLAAFVDSAIGADAAHLQVTEGDVISEIVGLATALPADIVVMGTHGISGFKQSAVGVGDGTGVARGTVSGADRATTSRATVARRGVSCDGRLCCGFLAIIGAGPRLCRLDSKEGGGRLVLLHALEWFDEETEASHAGSKTIELPTSEEDARQGLEELLTADARACDPELVVGHGSPAEEVLRVVRGVRRGIDRSGRPRTQRPGPRDLWIDGAADRPGSAVSGADGQGLAPTTHSCAPATTGSTSTGLVARRSTPRRVEPNRTSSTRPRGGTPITIRSASTCAATSRIPRCGIARGDPRIDLTCRGCGNLAPKTGRDIRHLRMNLVDRSERLAAGKHHATGGILQGMHHRHATAAGSRQVERRSQGNCRRNSEVDRRHDVDKWSRSQRAVGRVLRRDNQYRNGRRSTETAGDSGAFAPAG